MLVSDWYYLTSAAKAANFLEGRAIVALFACLGLAIKANVILDQELGRFREMSNQ